MRPGSLSGRGCPVIAPCRMLRDVRHEMRAIPVHEPQSQSARQCTAWSYSEQAWGRDIINPNTSSGAPDPAAAPVRKGAQLTDSKDEYSAEYWPREASTGRQRRRGGGRTGDRQPGPGGQYASDGYGSGRGANSNSRGYLRTRGRGRGRGQGRNAQRSGSGDRGRGWGNRGHSNEPGALWDTAFDENMPRQNLQAGPRLRPPAPPKVRAGGRFQQTSFERGFRDGAYQQRQGPRRTNESAHGGGGGAGQDGDDVWGAGNGNTRAQGRNAWSRDQFDGEYSSRGRSQGGYSGGSRDGRGGRSRRRDGRGGQGRRRDGRGGRGRREGGSNGTSSRRVLSPEQRGWQSALSSYSVDDVGQRQDEQYQKMIASLRDEAELGQKPNRATSKTRYQGGRAQYEAEESSRAMLMQSGGFEMQFGGSGGSSSSWLDLDDDMGMYEADFARLVPEGGDEKLWWTGEDAGAQSGGRGVRSGASASTHDNSDSWWLPEDGAVNSEDTDSDLDALLSLLGGVDLVDKPSTASEAQQGGSSALEEDSGEQQISSAIGSVSFVDEPLSEVLHSHCSRGVRVAVEVGETDGPRWAQPWQYSGAQDSIRGGEGEQGVDSSYSTVPPPVVPRIVENGTAKKSSDAGPLTFDDGDLLMDWLQDFPN